MDRRLQRVALVGLLAAATPLLDPRPARADFSAEGRKKKGHPAPAGKPTTGGGTRPSAGAANKPPAGGAIKSGEALAKPGAEGSDKGPGVDALIARYTGIVMAQPGATFPLQRLTQLYRDRDGNLAKLTGDLKARADAGGEGSWAAKVALAGVFKQEGRTDDAIKAYEAAIAERPKEAPTVFALAQLLQDKGDVAGARRRYEEGLALTTNAADKEQTLRTLMSLALASNDLDAARGYHKRLVALAGGSLLLRGELGRELMNRGRFAEAETEFADVVRAAAGDNRALAPALRDLGRAQAKAKKNAEALTTLKRALAVAGGEAGVRADVLATIAEVYRANNDLPSLVALLEKENPGDFQRLVMLGGLYEETGAVDKAIATYRRALGVNGKNIETRLRVVRLLQGEGELDQAIAENERLIQAAPRNPDFVFQLCETLLQRGDRQKALGLLAKLEQGASGDQDVLTRVADFYERIDEKDRAMKVFARLTSVAPGDPSVLVELGDRYWQAGDKKRAMETWQRIRTAVGNKAKALAALGEVLLDHDLTQEALVALKESVESEPQNVRYRKGYALALERSAPGSGSPSLAAARYDEARAAWEDLLAKSGQDKLLGRESRGHIVTLWALLKQLDARTEPLKRRLHDDPPDLEAGRLLAEAQIRARKLADAETTLAFVTARAPGDEEAFLALERVRVMKQDLPGAVAALGKLVDIDPKRAREFYQRMAQYSAELYKDDDAIAYAAKAVALAPDDADGHRKLGDMYRRRQDLEHAAAEYRLAIAKNDRLFAVYLQLAELLVARGEVDEADRLYRRVLRAAPDEELVAQAGRLSVQRNLVKGTLPDLENELLPLALGNPSKLVYRRLLVELYGQMAFPLVQRVRFGSPDEARAARDKLVAIGAHGVKPLLDALGDEQASQVSTALDVLAYVENKGAGPALAAFATGNADAGLRVRAMLATGALRDPALLPRYHALLAPKNAELVAPGDPVTVAAAWSVARMGDKRAVALLEAMLSSAAPDLRAFGALGLGLAKDHASVGRLAQLASAPDAAPIARAAAAEALGEIGDPSAAPTLVAVAGGPDPLVRAAAYGALARLGSPTTVAAAAPALFSDDDVERRAAAFALVSYVTKDALRPADPLPVGGPVTPRASLEGLFPRAPSPQARVKTLVTLRAELARAAAAAAGASPERAMRLADALLAGGGRAHPSFGPLTEGADALPEADRRAAEGACTEIWAASLPRFARLVDQPSPEVKARALLMLEGGGNDDAVAALDRALSDDDEKVVRAALAAVAQTPRADLAGRVTRLLSSSPSWAVRVAAADALGAAAGRASGHDLDEARRALARASKGDPFAFVREAALRALFAAKAPEARAVAADVARSDVDPQLRERAVAMAR